MLERCVGIKLAKGMQRTPGSFMIPNIKRMNVGIRNITSTYSSHWQAETELDYDLDRAISDLFDVEAPRFWGRSEERWEYLADAQHDPLGGVYLRNLYWPEDADRYVAYRLCFANGLLLRRSHEAVYLQFSLIWWS